MKPTPYAARRARLAAALARHALATGTPDRPALIAAGLPPPRNYAHNPYPFRAASHFLYLVGHALPGAYLLLDGDRATLYLNPPPPDDALWHGPTPDFDQLAATTGCTIRPLTDLPRALAAATLTLPAIDAPTRAHQSQLLHRPIDALAPHDHPLADALIELRLHHDAHAIAELRAAADATVAAHQAGRAAIKPGLTEAHVWAAMQAELTTRGMGIAYNPIVTRRGEILHERTHHRRLEPGDLLLIDVGAETPGGWAADVTRTWPVGGPLSTTQAEIHQLVRTTQHTAIAAARPGARYRDVHLTAARTLTAGLVDLGILRGDIDELVADDIHALFFPHGIGHLIGLDVHDMEDLGDRAGYAPGRSRSQRFGLGYLRLDRDLAPGMAVTIEPGFYQVPAILEDPARTAKAADRLDRRVLARFADVRGIRIEDDILITDAEPEVLTAALAQV